jgi:type III secretion protein R
VTAHAYLALPHAGLADRPAELLLLLGALSLAPLVLVTLTSFLKMSVVLSLTRSALGAPQVPPSAAVAGLALLLTAVAMAPVARACWERGRSVPAEDVDGALEAVAAASEPLRAFLQRFARPEDRQTFLELAQRAGEASGSDLAVLAPAFVVSELRRAFLMGFILFLPFLVVDLLAANVLLSLGLTQLSPTTVSLPFKLILFVAVDGWRLLARGLVLGYLA